MAGLRERTKRAVQTEIAAAAMQLFLGRGFEAVTMDEVARAAGVSRRSLFRYFGTKEDLVLGNLADVGEASAAILRDRPAGEPPWVALRAAFEDFMTSPDYSADWAFKIADMVHRTPSLRTRRLEKQLTWLDHMIPAIEARLTGPDTGLRAHAIVAAALACLDAATETWLAQDGRGDIAQLYDAAVAAVRGSD